MATSIPLSNAASAAPATTAHGVQQVQLTLRLLFGVVPIVAGLDKFTRLLAEWKIYLNPLALNVVPVTAATFMHVVGVIEIIAGALVLARPRVGAYVVMGWLIAIALQLILWGRFLDVAVRDLVIALGGAWTLARLSALQPDADRPAPNV